MGRAFGARELKDVIRRAAATLLSLALTFANIPHARALESILGTIQVKGPA